MADVAEVLNAAADLLEKPGAWTQDAYTRDLKCFCALGAIAHVSRVGATVAGRTAPAKALAHYLDAHDASSDRVITRWNDAPGRTQAEVVAALRQAALRSTHPTGADQ